MLPPAKTTPIRLAIKPSRDGKISCSPRVHNNAPTTAARLMIAQPFNGDITPAPTTPPPNLASRQETQDGKTDQCSNPCPKQPHPLSKPQQHEAKNNNN